MILDREGNFCNPKELTLGSVYKPLFDFESCNVPLHYVSNEYKKQCNNRITSLLGADFKVHSSFLEEDIQYLGATKCAEFFWRNYIVSQKESHVIGAFDKVKSLVRDRFNDVPCIPTLSGNVRKPSELYSLEIFRYAKHTPLYEDNVPIPFDYYDTKGSVCKELYDLLAFRMELDFNDALSALDFFRGPNLSFERSTLVRWLVNAYTDADASKITEYRSRESSVWLNRHGEPMQISKMYALDIASPKLVNYFGGNPCIIDSRYLTDSDYFFKSACDVLQIPVITDNDITIEPISGILFKEKDQDLKIFALIFAAIKSEMETEGSWKLLYNRFLSRIDSLQIYKCNAISIVYTSDKNIANNILKFCESGDIFYFVESLDNKRVFSAFVHAFTEYIGVNLGDNNIAEEIMDSKESAEQYFKDHYEDRVDDEFKAILHELDSSLAIKQSNPYQHYSEDDNDTLPYQYQSNYESSEEDSEYSDESVNLDDSEDDTTKGAEHLTELSDDTSDEDVLDSNAEYSNPYDHNGRSEDHKKSGNSQISTRNTSYEHNESDKHEGNDTKGQNQNGKSNATGEDSFHGKQRNTNLDEMSSSQQGYSVPTNESKDEVELEDKINDIHNKHVDEESREKEKAQKRANLKTTPKYSKKWFDTLLQLEYSSSTAEANVNRALKIIFGQFTKESESRQVYILSDPSRAIPMWIEEVDGITVKFSFYNQNDRSYTFEVANVKDFTLRVKAKSGDVSSIDKIDWRKCTKAIIEVTKPVELVGKLKSAFQALPYDDSFNFKDNLDKNVSFVFGPPGTGKTTRIADIISHRMVCDRCRILVLAPTNKACDVITTKLMESNNGCYSWLGRFVATGEENIEKEGVLIDRSSTLWNKDKCCIVSTMARLPYDGFASLEGYSLLKDNNWDLVVVDEASMIPLAQIVFAIYNFRETKIIIAGDPLQIPPIVKEEEWKDENIYSMVHLDNFESPKTEPIQFDVETLNRQYRSIASIGNLYSNYCYGGKLEHERTDNNQHVLPMGEINAKAINFIPFRVERYDSIFGAKKLNNSNVHIYSAIFAVEMCAYIARQQTENVRIGIICPYTPQAQIINKLIEQREDIPCNVAISVGTIHGFQGDQCDIVFVVLNPPVGISAVNKIMLNRQNIINVAISRPKDYLYILLPHPDSHGYENLIEVNKLCRIAKKHVPSVTVINADDIEQKIFGQRDYIESNTFVTNHQLANVYTKPAGLYEVRIDENAIDIQVGKDFSKKPSSLDKENSDNQNVYDNKEEHENEFHAQEPEIGLETNDEKLVEENTNDIISESNIIENKLEDEINQSKLYKTPGMYLLLFEKYKINLSKALDIVLNNDTICSIYVAFLIVGSKKYRNQLGWKNITLFDITNRLESISKSQYGMFLYNTLVNAFSTKNFPIRHISKFQMEDVNILMFEDAFVKAFERYKNNSKPIGPAHKRKKKHKVKNTTSYFQSRIQEDNEEDKLYNKYDYDLSDW